MLDMLVVGGGYVGLSAAVAVKQAAPHLKVSVVEAAPEHVWKNDARASAVIAAAVKMLEIFGIWTEIAPEAQPITKMIVTDSRTSDPVRPVFLTFDGEVAEGRPFAHMIPNVVMVGEIRDVETADIAIRAAMTGHLVFSTLHTNDAVGGITRLTQSGLSIVEWQPLVGVVPPLTESAWHQRFERYRAFPQYLQLRPQMTLHEFKVIFFWEYLHRVIARAIGVIFMIPFLLFWMSGYFSRPLMTRALALFGLGAMQGVMGWLMVKSGLVDRPSVGTGTVIRPSTVESIAREAGFTGFTILPVEHESFRFYRLDP